MDRDDSLEIPTTPVLENPEHQTKWYYKYFLGKFHSNFVGQDIAGHTYVLSVLSERSFGKTQQRAILWTKDGPKRLCMSSGKASGGGVGAPNPKAILGHFGTSDKMEKPPREVRMFYPAFLFVNVIFMRVGSLIYIQYSRKRNNKSNQIKSYLFLDVPNAKNHASSACYDPSIVCCVCMLS